MSCRYLGSSVSSGDISETYCEICKRSYDVSVTPNSRAIDAASSVPSGRKLPPFRNDSPSGRPQRFAPAPRNGVTRPVTSARAMKGRCSSAASDIPLHRLLLDALGLRCPEQHGDARPRPERVLDPDCVRLSPEPVPVDRANEVGRDFRMPELAHGAGYVLVVGVLHVVSGPVEEPHDDEVVGDEAVPAQAVLVGTQPVEEAEDGVERGVVARPRLR